MPRPTSGPAISSASSTLTDGSSARVIGAGITTNAAAKKNISTPTLRNAELSCRRASSRSWSASAREICGNIAVATDTAISEYGSMNRV